MNDEASVQSAANSVWGCSDNNIRTREQFNAAKHECAVDMQFRLDAVRALTYEQYLKFHGGWKN